jgi:hypothetical protein
MNGRICMRKPHLKLSPQPSKNEQSCLSGQRTATCERASNRFSSARIAGAISLR